MKQFIIKSTGFIALVLISILAVFNMADGSTDANYLKFTTPKQSSLIIGSSRAAQGIQPKELMRVLKRDDIYNYAFQIPSSPYGEVYFESIKKKVDTNAKNGLFILEVNPWTIASQMDLHTRKEKFSEKSVFIDNTKYVNLKPNIEYLIESYGESYINILKDRNRKGAYQTFFVEDDGWLRATIESDMISREDRTKNKLKTYNKKLDLHDGLSNYRKTNLIETIKYLKQFGSVYLVRLPVIDGMLQIENKLWANFDSVMLEIASANQIPYIDMMTENSLYDYTDGNHLDISSGVQFSLDLARKIEAFENNLFND